MGFLDYFKNKNKLKVEKIFDEAKKFHNAKHLVDKAISFRTLKQYDMAIKILYDVIDKYPSYLPAKTILGTTFLLSGNIDKAEKQLKQILLEHLNDEMYPLTEIYANLGNLYYFYKNNKVKALEYYELALNSPITSNINSEIYDLMISGVYRDLSQLYVQEGENSLAKKYASMRLKLNKDCPIAAKVYALCLYTDFMNDNNSITFFKEPIKSDKLNEAIEHLYITLKQFPNDYSTIAILCIICNVLRMTRYYIINENELDLIDNKAKRYFDKLKLDSNNSKEAKDFLEMITKETKNNFTKIMNSLLPKIKTSFKNE